MNGLVADAILNSPAPPPLLAPPVIEPPRPGALAKLRRAAVAVWKYFAGATQCATIVGSMVIVGWTYRLVRRSVLKQWWKRSPLRQGGVSFETFLDGSDVTRETKRWPNWFVQQNAREKFRAPGVRAKLKALVHSLWLNFKIGVQGIFNTWVLTMPGCVLMLFSWYDGWQNSFHKGYELAWVGPTTGLTGIALFIWAMLYVPMAQARQAATGDWRTFYQFRFVRSLIRRRWWLCIGLAALYSLASLPIMALAAVPGFVGAKISETPGVTYEQLMQFVRTYYFWAGFYVFGAFVLVRLAAARVYASAVLAVVETGGPALAALGHDERAQLARLGLLRQRPEPERHPVVKAIGWTGSLTLRAFGTILVVVLWFTFIAQTYIGVFFNYHGAKQWLNQPLAQLPWFFDTPDKSAELATPPK